MTSDATTRAELARIIDDTLLEPEATDDDVARLAKEAEQLRVGAMEAIAAAVGGRLGVKAAGGHPHHRRSSGDDRGRRHADRHLTYRGHPERSTR